MAEQRVSAIFTGTTQTNTLANIASSITAVTLFEEHAYARVRTVYNDSTSIAYMKFGSGASSTSYTVQLAAGAYYEFPQPLYAGLVSIIWVTANGAARITEW